MTFGLTMGTERATALQKAIEAELITRGYSAEPDAVMAEYITIMVINNKTPQEITSELEDLIGLDYDSAFTDWLFVQAAKDAPAEAAPASSAPPQSAPTPTAADAPQPIPIVNNERRVPGLYQSALNQALPNSSPSAQKRTASARSPSPNGRDPSKVARRTDVPTGPRAMFRDGQSGQGSGSGGGRSLLDRMQPRQGGNRHQGGHHGPRAHDEIQARIDSITNGGMVGGLPGPMGMHPGMMPGMDMNSANPMMLQEMMMNQMALMAQMASQMGIINPAALQASGGQPFPFMPPNPEMVQNGGQGGPLAQGGHTAGRGGRGGMPAGRGRGGHINGGAPRSEGPSPAPPQQNAAAPTPAPTATPAQAAAAAARPGFVPPERPQTPTLCIFGTKCTNATCRFSHPSPVATAQSGVVLSTEPCENGIKCTDPDCVKGHVSPAAKSGVATPSDHKPFAPSNAPVPAASATPDRFATPCRFGSGCTRATCPFQHPEGRVLPTTFYRGLSGDQVVNVKGPETGTMGAQSHNRSMTFNKAPTAGGSAKETLERKMREIEERKREVAELEKKAAAKKSSNGATPDNKPLEATA